MTNYRTVSDTSHAGRRWQRPGDYAFAGADAVAPLVVQEMAKAAPHLPIGFVQSGAAFVPVAVQGLTPGTNLFVAPDGGWLAGYVPAAYRSHPFAQARTESGEQVLCVDEDSAAVGKAGLGEPYFNDDGTLAEAVAEVLDFLTQVARGRQATERICAVLQEHRLIMPWTIRLTTPEGEQSVEGLFRIDEDALNALPAEALDAVRRAGGLPVAYCQLLSMQQLPKLAELARARAEAGAKPLPVSPAWEPDLRFLDDGGTISFG